MESTKCASNMIVPEVLTEENYEVWKIFMKSYLLGEGLWDIVEGSEGRPESSTNPDQFMAWRMRNGKALHAIMISCGAEKVFSLNGERESAKDAWDHLAFMFQQNTKEKNALPSEAETSMSKEREPASKAESNGSEENKLGSEGGTNFLPKQIMLPSNAAGTSSSVGEEEMAAREATARYLAVCRAVYFNDWERTKSLLEKYPDCISAIISPIYGTVLHVAVTSGNLQLVNQLLEFMTPDAIDTVITSCRVTPLSIAACCGFTKIAEALVEKVRYTLEIPGNGGHIPVVSASGNSHKDTTCYLYAVTRKEALIEGGGTEGASLLNFTIVSEIYDVAMDILCRYPHLSITYDCFGWTTIKMLATRPNAFASGGHCSKWQQLIYSS